MLQNSTKCNGQIEQTWQTHGTLQDIQKIPEEIDGETWKARSPDKTSSCPTVPHNSSVETRPAASAIPCHMIVVDSYWMLFSLAFAHKNAGAVPDQSETYLYHDSCPVFP